MDYKMVGHIRNICEEQSAKRIAVKSLHRKHLPQAPCAMRYAESNLQNLIRHVGLYERPQDRERGVLAGEKLLRQPLHLLRRDLVHSLDDIIHGQVFAEI